MSKTIFIQFLQRIIWSFTGFAVLHKGQLGQRIKVFVPKVSAF
jgi:hypothetical protein